MSVKTIQEHLETRASQEANEEVRRQILRLPVYHGRVSIPRGLIKEEGAEMTISWENLKESLRQFMQDQHYEWTLDRMTQELLNKLDKRDG